MLARLVLSAIVIFGVSPVFGAPFIIGTAGNTGIGTWTLISCPAGSSCASAIPITNELAAAEPGTPEPTWLTNDVTSQWIRPSAPAASEEPGFYTYRTRFDLTGFLPNTAELTFRAAADDLVSNVMINGNATGINFIGFGEWHPTAAPFYYTINANFTSGINTLDFIVENVSGIGSTPTGLRVEFLSSAADLEPAEPEVPEPATMGLMGLGLLGLGVFRFRRSKA